MCTSFLLLFSVLTNRKLDYIFLVFCYVLIVFLHTYILSLNKWTIHKEYEELQDIKEAHQKLYCIEHIVEESHKENGERILLQGYILEYIKLHNKEENALIMTARNMQLNSNNSSGKTFFLYMENIRVLAKLHIKDIYENIQKVYPNCLLFKLLYLEHIIYVEKNLQGALKLIAIIEKIPKSLKEEAIFTHFKYVLYELLAENKGNSIQIDLFQSFDISSEQFTCSLQSATNIYSQFWSIIQDTDPNLTTTIEICDDIQLANLEIKRKYNGIINLNTGAIQLSMLYAKYLADIVQDPYLSQTIITM